MLLLPVLILLGWNICGSQQFFRPLRIDDDSSIIEGTAPGGVWVPPTPCPGIFEYRWWGNEVVGFAMVAPPNRASLSEPINLIVNLAVESIVTTGYAGIIELMEDKNTVFNRIQRGDLRPIYYRIRFPLRSPIASLLSIEVNNQVVCQSNRVSPSTVVTKLTLNHSLVPDKGTALNVPSNNQIQEPAPWWQQNNNQQQPWQQQTTPAPAVWQQPLTTPPYWLQTTSQSPPIQPVNSGFPTAVNNFNGQDSSADECGIPASPPSLFLVQNGAPTSKGQWPWLAAIFIKTSVGQDFQCGGSLVSKGHIITAAHCIKDPNKAALSADSILVFVGKFNLRRAEPDAQPRDVSRIVLHPSYGSGKYDNDIAVLLLETPVLITRSVRPVCLWPENSQTLSNRMGTVSADNNLVVGWGRDENGNRVTDEPKLARMPLVTQEECLRSHHDFYYLTSETTFCAGGRDGSGPCNGDSGGGMYFSHRQPGGGSRWMLRGVVSLSLQDENTRECDLSNYIVFTDVVKFMPWIRSIIGS